MSAAADRGAVGYERSRWRYVVISVLVAAFCLAWWFVAPRLRDHWVPYKVLEWVSILAIGAVGFFVQAYRDVASRRDAMARFIESRHLERDFVRWKAGMDSPG